MRIFIEQIIRKAGKEALKYFKKSGLKYAHKKNVADIVTEADHASNNVLLAAIKKKFPTHGIISEETGERQANAEYIWIIDPVDGTRNFFTHTPLWGVMVGLAREGEMITAAIYDPNHDELVYAERGKGVRFNGKFVRCGKNKNMSYSMGCTSSVMRKEKMPMHIKISRGIGGREVWMSMFGSVAINALYVAVGRRDWLVTSGGAVWDYAPAALVLREAGCIVTDFKGKFWQLNSREIVAANPHLHTALLKIVR